MHERFQTGQWPAIGVFARFPLFSPFLGNPRELEIGKDFPFDGRNWDISFPPPVEIVFRLAATQCLLLGHRRAVWPIVFTGDSAIPIASSQAAVAGLGLAVVLLAGCHVDANLRKQKYLERGNRYSTQGWYKEAAIEYLNALASDGNCAEAHHQLAPANLHRRASWRCLSAVAG